MKGSLINNIAYFFQKKNIIFHHAFSNFLKKAVETGKSGKEITRIERVNVVLYNNFMLPIFVGE